MPRKESEDEFLNYYFEIAVRRFSRHCKSQQQAFAGGGGGGELEESFANFPAISEWHKAQGLAPSSWHDFQCGQGKEQPLKAS